jgi:hypothetical protein
MDQSLSQANLTFTGDYPYDLTGFNSFFAFDVSGIGDINNDSCADFSISAPFVNSREGIIFVIFGNRSWPLRDTTSTTTFTSPSTSTSTTSPAWTALIVLVSLGIIGFRKQRLKA